LLTSTDFDSQSHGLHAEDWTNARFEGEPCLVRTDEHIGLNLGFFNSFGQGAFSLPPTPQELNNAMSVRWSGNITVPATGDATLALTQLGTDRLFLNGRLLIEDHGVTLQTQTVTMQLVAGQSYPLRIEYAADRPE